MILHKRRLSAKSCFVFLFCFCLSLSLGAQERYAKNSVLSNGHWVKIAIEKNGIYKLTNSELKKMGFDDPSKVAVYGYGGWPLEEDFSKPYVDDLPAVPVLRKDDYLLFYGRGTTKWEYKTMRYSDGRERQTFVHTNNPYSDLGYYFLTSSQNVKEMETVKSEPKDGVIELNTFDDYLLHEKDLVSLNKSGRELFGESLMSTISVPFDNIEGIVQEDAVVECRLIAKTIENKNFTLSIGNEDVVKGSVPGIFNAQNSEYIKARAADAFGFWTGKKDKSFIIKVNYSEKYNQTAYLDYIRVHLKRALQTYNEPTFFRNVSSINHKSCFTIKNANSNTIVLDVTEAQNPKVVEAMLSGTELSFVIPQSYQLREFAVVQLDKSVPSIAAKDAQQVGNQNLHSTKQVDMVIISPSAFKSEAERLKKAHEEKDDLVTEVFTPEEIYNEFSSGTPDATAYRRLMKMFYDRGKEDAKAPKYLLLFGDGAFDNRFVTNDWKKVGENEKNNMLLTYQTTESLDMYSYTVDDYFGFLKDSGKDISMATLDIAVGRFPVRTRKQATEVVDKVISYMNNSDLGIWKNNLCFIADDGNNADSFKVEHQIDAENLALTREIESPEYIANKIYFDAFKKDLGGAGKYPEVEERIVEKLKNGMFLLNYVGHGNTENLSDEQVIKHNDILKYTYKHLPLWITATCDFCRFDAVATSAGEDVFLRDKSGGIALFTTSRVAFTDINERMNRQFMNLLFKKENDLYLTLGEVMKQTKLGEKTDKRKLGFCLIGDPALRLSYPKHRVQVTTINGSPVGKDTVVFNANAWITVEGDILDTKGSLVSDFNGELRAKILDGYRRDSTLGNNPYKNKIYYHDYFNTVFEGGGSVKDGKFKFTFKVPKDISYSDNTCGKMSLYAFDKTAGEDAQGYFNKFLANGTKDDPDNDSEGPEIRSLFLNDSTFVSGDKVNNTPYFYARLWDKSGINVTGSSIGHDITLNIDNNPVTNYTLNSYYEFIPDSEGEGIVKFAIPALEPGLHDAEFKVWDIMNNPTTCTFQFEVIEGLKPFISRLIATPTPAKGNVKFRLWHNRPETQMKVGILVYDITGRLHWKHEETGSSELFKDYVIDWDLRNNAGSHVRPGVYLYRAAISTNNSKEATETQKMIILW
jgi:hypothetical protein